MTKFSIHLYLYRFFRTVLCYYGKKLHLTYEKQITIYSGILDVRYTVKIGRGSRVRIKARGARKGRRMWMYPCIPNTGSGYNQPSWWTNIVMLILVDGTSTLFIFSVFLRIFWIQYLWIFGLDEYTLFFISNIFDLARAPCFLRFWWFDGHAFFRNFGIRKCFL